MTPILLSTKEKSTKPYEIPNSKPKAKTRRNAKVKTFSLSISTW